MEGCGASRGDRRRGYVRLRPGRGGSGPRPGRLVGLRFRPTPSFRSRWASRRTARSSPGTRRTSRPTSAPSRTTAPAMVLDPADRERSPARTTSRRAHTFCSLIAALPDGRLAIIGGGIDSGRGATSGGPDLRRGLEDVLRGRADELQSAGIRAAPSTATATRSSPAAPAPGSSASTSSPARARTSTRPSRPTGTRT